MLAGIGGRSVYEAKRNLSQFEFADWCEYREKFGSLHLGMRLEYGFALIAALIKAATGKETSIGEFMPHLEKHEATLEEVMGILSGVKK